MSIIKLTIRTAPEHWFWVRPYFEETTSALNLSVLPLRKWHGQLCVCVCCLISSLLKVTNEFQKHTGKVRVGAKELKSRRFSRFPPSQAGMMNSRTETISEGCCSLGWDPPGGLPGAQQLGLVGTPPKRDTHFLPSLPPAPYPQDSRSSISAPPLRGQGWQNCTITVSIIFVFFQMSKNFTNQDTFSLKEEVILFSSIDSYNLSQ